MTHRFVAVARMFDGRFDFLLLFNLYRYTSEGNCKGVAEFVPPSPIRLRWEMPKACVDRIESSYQVALALLNDVDLRLLVHSAFGKGLMKKCRISPDAFIQMALQLAYYRVRTPIY
jgi:carnitine O-palmitoyltransferase 1